MSVLSQNHPITIFDKTLTQVAYIDDYETASFEHGWYAPGAFSMSINFNKPNALVFTGFEPKTGSVLYAMFSQDVTKVAKITHVNNHLDEGGKGTQTVTATGYEVWGWFSQRLVLPPAGQTNYTVTGNPEAVIKTAISDQAGPTATDSNRAFPLLTIAANQNRSQSFATSYTLNVQNTNLLEELKKCALASQMGIFSTVDIANKKIIVDIGLGLDRTPGNAAGNTTVILSSTYDETQSADLDVMEDNYKNFVYVRSGGTAGLQTVLTLPASSIPTGQDRYEQFVDASSFQTSDPTLTADLTAQGNQVLRQNQFTTFLNSNPLAYEPYVYGVDFNVGDLLQLQEFNVTQNVRLISMKEDVSPLQYTLRAQYDRQIPDITQQVGTAIAQLVSNQNNAQATPVQTTASSGKAVELSDGTIIQRGTATAGATSGSTASVTFPVPFIDTAYALTFSFMQSGATISGTSALICTAFSTTGFTVTRQNSSNLDTFTRFAWIAVGAWK